MAEDAEMPRFALWILLLMAPPVLWAQSSSPGAAATAKDSGATSPAWRTRTIRFASEKAVLGLPLTTGKVVPHCSTDGTAFFDISSGSAMAGSQLFSISTDGEVKHLLRKLPFGFSNVSVLDFFAGETLVTLLKAEQRDGGTDSSPPRETDYFVSISDHDGDLSKLVQIDIRFRPLKVARFGAGDLVVLGWDEGNLQPELAMLKEDGTIRRFIDLDEKRPSAARGVEKEGTAAERESPALKSLQGAAFAPYGSEVMLTYPGTAKPIQVLTGVGESRTIPIALPAGYVLHDALASSGSSRGTLIVRAQEAKVQAKLSVDDATPAPKMHLFEMASSPGPSSGAFLDELIFAKPQVSDVTCAGSSSLTALFYDTIPDANKTAPSPGTENATDGPQDVPTQLVVSTTRR